MSNWKLEKAAISSSEQGDQPGLEEPISGAQAEVQFDGKGRQQLYQYGDT